MTDPFTLDPPTLDLELSDLIPNSTPNPNVNTEISLAEYGLEGFILRQDKYTIADDKGVRKVRVGSAVLHTIPADMKGENMTTHIAKWVANAYQQMVKAYCELPATPIEDAQRDRLEKARKLVHVLQCIVDPPIVKEGILKGPIYIETNQVVLVEKTRSVRTGGGPVRNLAGSGDYNHLNPEDVKRGGFALNGPRVMYATFRLTKSGPEYTVIWPAEERPA
ncbi:MAG: hypothetical protein AABX70_04980 [Nanoarchaeota archaeon]